MYSKTVYGIGQQDIGLVKLSDPAVGIFEIEFITHAKTVPYLGRCTDAGNNHE